jgi:hypothetical protein
VPAVADTTHGFPYLSGAGRLIIKDVIMFGAAVVTLADSAKAYLSRSSGIGGSAWQGRPSPHSGDHALGVAYIAKWGETNIDDASRKVAAVFRASVPQDADCRGNPKVPRRLLSHSIWAKCLSRKFATKSACIALSFAMNPVPVGADEGIS